MTFPVSEADYPRLVFQGPESSTEGGTAWRAALDVAQFDLFLDESGMVQFDTYISGFEWVPGCEVGMGSDCQCNFRSEDEEYLSVLCPDRELEATADSIGSDLISVPFKDGKLTQEAMCKALQSWPHPEFHGEFSLIMLMRKTWILMDEEDGRVIFDGVKPGEETPEYLELLTRVEARRP